MARTTMIAPDRQLECRPPGSRRAGVAIVLALVLALAGAPAFARPAPESFADLAERLLPAVVNVSTTQVVEGNPGIELPQLPPGSPLEEFFKEFMERNQPKQSPRRRATSLGSGFFIDSDGHIVTNNHVIQDADEVSVILHDDTRLEAKIVGRDAKTDIAVLKVAPQSKITPVHFGDSDAIRVGDWVLAIGNPFGFGGTVTAGIISARGRDINAGPYDDFLQTDASINRGNSGGPMFDLDGEVIGINTAIFSPSGGSVGIGFAIPSNSARSVIQQLIEHGQVQRGWLGVRIQTVTDEIADALGMKESGGALVAGVIPGGPAEKAKLKDGDVIVEFDHKPVTQMRRLPRLVADTEVGRTVPVKVWRDGHELTLDVQVGALDETEEKAASTNPGPETPSTGEKIDALGVDVVAIDPKVRDRYELEDDAKGVVVTGVDQDGPAAEQGIKVGDRIVEVAQEPVSTPAQLLAKIKGARAASRKALLMLVEGEGGVRFVAIKLGKG